MVDRESRSHLAVLLKSFVAGDITNRQFEAAIPESNDRVISAIVESIWCFYDDFIEHKLIGDRSASDELEKDVSRWVLFLLTDNEYEWPPISYPGVRPLKHGFISIFNGSRILERKFVKYGDYFVWPFVSFDSFRKAQDDIKKEETGSDEA